MLVSLQTNARYIPYDTEIYVYNTRICQKNYSLFVNKCQCVFDSHTNTDQAIAKGCTRLKDIRTAVLHTHK